MRFDTKLASNYLIWWLQYADHVNAILDDGHDLVLLELVTGERILIYLEERLLSPKTIAATYRENSRQGIYTLFFFWCDMLLPPPNRQYLLDDWMVTMIQLHGDIIYGYEVLGGRVYFFPVNFEGKGYERRITFGWVVDFSTLGCHHVNRAGETWYVAGFGHERPRESNEKGIPATLEGYYAILQLPVGAGLAEVKIAYRDLARQIHPDVNNASDATWQMQLLNVAYQQLVAHLVDDER